MVSDRASNRATGADTAPRVQIAIDGAVGAPLLVDISQPDDATARASLNRKSYLVLKHPIKARKLVDTTAARLTVRKKLEVVICSPKCHPMTMSKRLHVQNN
jgi:hypothetical protein